MNAMRCLQGVPGSALLRVLLGLLLLVAQHGALTHALAHASGHAHLAPAAAVAAAPVNDDSHGHSHGHEHARAHGPDGEGRNANSQCTFDLLYSELLGGALLIDSVITAGAMIPGTVIPVAAHALSATSLPYRSRGPPPERA